MRLISDFSIPAVHNVVYADDFCSFAEELRRELLQYPSWIEMTQDNQYSASQLRTDRQTGITTGHIGDSHKALLPYSIALRQVLSSHVESLAQHVGVEIGGSVEIEMNAMAYGSGGWLSPHTDYNPGDPKPRRVAWMLYLTHPEDEEWSNDKGGAVRLFAQNAPTGSTMGPSESLLRPRFNRFAMFRVSETSLHEIEPVRWDCGWDRCRLALSGWFRSPADPSVKTARLYARRRDAVHVRTQKEARLRGAIAMYSLLRLQRVHAGHVIDDLERLLKLCETELDAHVTAPPGTVFLRHAPGPASCIIVVDENGQVMYLGSRDRYPGT